MDDDKKGGEGKGDKAGEQNDPGQLLTDGTVLKTPHGYPGFRLIRTSASGFKRFSQAGIPAAAACSQAVGDVCRRFPSTVFSLPLSAFMRKIKQGMAKKCSFDLRDIP
ncbi:hypothetical protein ACJ77P_12840 [Syntrophus buswellii]|jgi:hypothetical protein|uniref:hypothetical protein n=1 Tax=Syntrophus TaxID=43773 RepID=UPI00345E9E9E